MERKHALYMALVGTAVLAVAPWAVPSWITFILTKALFMYIAVQGVALFLRAGMVTFGHALFYATGAYVVGFSVKWFGFRDVLLLVPLGALTGLIMVIVLAVRPQGLFGEVELRRI